jgi:hypothetical protein
MTKYSGRTDVTDWQDEEVREQSVITNTTNASFVLKRKT